MARSTSVKTARPTAKIDTKQHVLDVAERLFAEHGVDAISLRHVIKEAGVNIAAIHYHFGSKDELLLELMARRLPKVVARRLELLGKCRTQPGRPPLVEQIVEAFVRPALELIEEDSPYGKQLSAKISLQRGKLQNRLYLDEYYNSDVKFVEALHEALPHVPMDTLYWRFSFMVASLVYTSSGIGRIEFLSGGLYDSKDAERAIKEAVSFLSAGFRAKV